MNFNRFRFITDLQASTLALDFRVNVLEENGGSDGNSSVAELELRVETLEGTTADHETRISATETTVTGIFFKITFFIVQIIFLVQHSCVISALEETVADQETRLTAAEENIQGIMCYQL